jgi:hypothetical protein
VFDGLDGSLFFGVAKVSDFRESFDPFNPLIERVSDQVGFGNSCHAFGDWRLDLASAF